MTKAGRRLVRPSAIITLAAAAAAAGLTFLAGQCDVCDAASSILLSGVVPGKCTMTVTADAQAANLPITGAGAHRVLVGTIVQNCTGTRSYTVGMTSMNCAFSPTGGKVMNEEAGEYLSYSGEFNNPTTGGSQAVVTGLLASACTGQIGRQVTSGHITNETSSLYINFTGSPALAAGTYQDIVTISLNMN